MDDPVLKPGDFLQFTRHLSFGDVLVGQGGIVFLISIPSEFEPTTGLDDPSALILHDERLIRVPDWWLRKNSVVL